MAGHSCHPQQRHQVIRREVLIGAGRPDAEPAVIAQAYLKLYNDRRDAELHYVAYDG
ncbi:hypothetical protein [Leifsonia sp. RAF41]|uniref:hypothetical protein n=1 Tax=Leifsonia sp. RAF41 TaxID=3233056 RepID=UPI003F97152B